MVVMRDTIRNRAILWFSLTISLILFCMFYSSVSAATEGEVRIFGATGSEQVFTAPVKGYYELETWGSQGGGNGGYGAYTTGVVFLEAGQKLYVNVGTQGLGYGQWAGGYNGGGMSGTGGGQWSYGGGGATHIAKTSGVLSSLNTNRSSILLVAAGGGGGGGSTPTCPSSQAANCPGGHGGGVAGVTGWDTVNASYSHFSGTGATLTGPGHSANSGANCGRGSFGQGGTFCNTSYGGAGGGGGFYGGGGSNRGHGTGGGGSSYMSEELLSYGGVTKATYCYACTVSNAVGTRTISVKAFNTNAITGTPKAGAGYA